MTGAFTAALHPRDRSGRFSVKASGSGFGVFDRSGRKLSWSKTKAGAEAAIPMHERHAADAAALDRRRAALKELEGQRARLSSAKGVHSSGMVGSRKVGVETLPTVNGKPLYGELNQVTKIERMERGKYKPHWEETKNPGTVVDAIPALARGEHAHVDLAHARETVHKVAKSKEPVNLANLHIDAADHGNLFDYSATDIPRSEMPQLGDAEDIKAFAKFARSKGITAKVEEVSPHELHATQNQINATKVDGITSAIEHDPKKMAQRVIPVASDGAVIDGHHGWASASLYAISHPDYKVKVLRINAPIEELIKIGREFAKQRGIANKGLAEAETSAEGGTEGGSGGGSSGWGEPPEGAKPPDPGKPYLYHEGVWHLLWTDRLDGVPPKLKVHKKKKVNTKLNSEPKGRARKAIAEAVTEAFTGVGFDALLHPRDRTGKFSLTGNHTRDVTELRTRLQGTRSGATVHLSNGAHVTKLGEHHFVVDHPNSIRTEYKEPSVGPAADLAAAHAVEGPDRLHGAVDRGAAETRMRRSEIREPTHRVRKRVQQSEEDPMSIQYEVAEAVSEVLEAPFSEGMHPRDRAGRWVTTHREPNGKWGYTVGHPSEPAPVRGAAAWSDEASARKAGESLLGAYDQSQAAGWSTLGQHSVEFRKSWEADKLTRAGNPADERGQLAESLRGLKVGESKQVAPNVRVSRPHEYQYRVHAPNDNAGEAGFAHDSAYNAAGHAIQIREHEKMKAAEATKRIQQSEVAEAVLEVLEAADSLAKASSPEPFSKSKTSNWVARTGGLPPYIQHIAHDLMEKRGKTESNAIQMAIGIVKNWASGKGKVDATTRAAAAKAVAEWEAKKGASKAVKEAEIMEAAIHRLTIAEADYQAALDGLAGDGLPLEWTAVQEAAATSTEGRKELADEGKAKSDGSFPIPNVEYLKKAIKAVGRAKDPGSAKAHIVKRAKALKATGLLPDSWKVQESAAADAVREVLEADAKAYCVKDKAMVTPDDEGKCPKCGTKLSKLKLKA